MIPEVSAGSNHVGASVTCTAQVSWPSGGPAARIEHGTPSTKATARRAREHRDGPGFGCPVGWNCAPATLPPHRSFGVDSGEAYCIILALHRVMIAQAALAKGQISCTGLIRDGGEDASLQSAPSPAAAGPEIIQHDPRRAAGDPWQNLRARPAAFCTSRCSRWG